MTVTVTTTAFTVTTSREAKKQTIYVPVTTTVTPGLPTSTETGGPHSTPEAALPPSQSATESSKLTARPSQVPVQPPRNQTDVRSSNTSSGAARPSAGSGDQGGSGSRNGSEGTSGNRVLALQANQRFKKLTNSSTCDANDSSQLYACIAGNFVQCVSGAYQIAVECTRPLQCFALPLQDKRGVSIACTGLEDAAERLGVKSDILASDLTDPLPSSDPLPTPTSLQPPPANTPTYGPSTGTSDPAGVPTPTGNPPGVPPLPGSQPPAAMPPVPAPPVVPPAPALPTSFTLSTQVVTVTTYVTSGVTPTGAPA
jgi:hypothetical protein